MQTAARMNGVLIAIVLLLGAFAPPPAGAASARKQCIKERCERQKKDCLKAFKQQFKDAKKGCDDKTCKKKAQKTFKQGQKACKKAAAPCKQCCKGDAVGC